MERYHRFPTSKRNILSHAGNGSRAHSFVLGLASAQSSLQDADVLLDMEIKFIFLKFLLASKKPPSMCSPPQDQVVPQSALLKRHIDDFRAALGAGIRIKENRMVASVWLPERTHGYWLLARSSHRSG
jgi:hypothetical protein